MQQSEPCTLLASVRARKLHTQAIDMEGLRTSVERTKSAAAAEQEALGSSWRATLERQRLESQQALRTTIERAKATEDERMREVTSKLNEQLRHLQSELGNAEKRMQSQGGHRPLQATAPLIYVPCLSTLRVESLVAMRLAHLLSVASQVVPPRIKLDAVNAGLV